MSDFVHDTPAQRVVVARGRAAGAVRAELERLGLRRVLVVAGPRQRAVAEAIGAAAGWDEIVQHVPAELADRATAAARGHGVDGVVALGGGSAIGLGKAVVLELGVPLVAVPTTFAGSEGTDVWGRTDADGKRTGTDPRVRPATVVYDSALTADLPLPLAVASGLNAVAHAVDTQWAPRADPLNTAQAAQALAALAGGLRALAAAPDDLEARAGLQLGCYLASVAFASAGSALHHKICHALGGTFGLPHAETHAVVLPYVLAVNAPAAPAAAARIAAALDARDAVAGLEALRRELDAPRALRDLGLAEADLPRAVDVVLPAVPPTNPRPVGADLLGALLRAAWAGTDLAIFTKEIAP